MENKAYKVRILTGAPEFDAAPVAKITDYPLEKRDYRPFAQCSALICGGTLYIRMWAFEASPAPTSELRGVFLLFSENPEAALYVRLAITGESSAAPECEAFITEGEGLLPLGVKFHARDYSGEDLQGVYWGATVSVSVAELEALAGKTLTQAGESFSGNFYKLCDDKKFYHRGSLFPADFAANPFDRKSMGAFELVGW